jgi:hypothetical protein
MARAGGVTSGSSSDRSGSRLRFEQRAVGRDRGYKAHDESVERAFEIVARAHSQDFNLVRGSTETDREVVPTTQRMAQRAACASNGKKGVGGTASTLQMQTPTGQG